MNYKINKSWMGCGQAFLILSERVSPDSYKRLQRLQEMGDEYTIDIAEVYVGNLDEICFWCLNLSQSIQ